MEFVRLGRTNETVSVVGLGCGGHSRLGMARGASAAGAADLVRHAVDLGITFVDTANVYGTEEAVGLALKGRLRQSVFVSTKSWVGRGGAAGNPEYLSPAEFIGNLESSLKKLNTDYIDVFHLHGVSLDQLGYARAVILPVLKRQQEAGKIRFIGITEVFRHDTGHRMLEQALPSNEFDVAMVGFSIINQSAREMVFPLTQQHDVGTLIMFAVRRGLGSVEATREFAAELVLEGEVDPDLINPEDPLDFLRTTPGVRSQIEAAYRFCRHEPGAHVVLTGTGSRAHLEENIASILAPPLPNDALEKLRAIFGKARSASGD